MLYGAAYESLKDAAYERDEGVCQLCRPKHWVSRAQATLDHIKLRKMGGGERDDVLDNVRIACWLGNNRRGSKR